MVMYCDKCRDEIRAKYHGGGDWECSVCGSLLSAFRELLVAASTVKDEEAIAIQINGSTEVIFGGAGAYDAIGLTIYSPRPLKEVEYPKDERRAMFIPWTSIAYVRTTEWREIRRLKELDEEEEEEGK